MPNSRSAELWTGQIRFEDENSSSMVTYFVPRRHPSNQMSRNMLLVARIHKALEGFCNAAGRSQRAGLLCNRFTILRRASFNHNEHVIEMCGLQLSLASNLLSGVKGLLGMGLMSSHRLNEVAAAAVMVVSTLDPHYDPLSLDALEDLPDSGDDIEPKLHICSLAVQLLCLGFISYCQGHSGSIRPFFLDVPQKKITMLGSQPFDGNRVSIIAELVELTCVGEMIQDSVLVFRTSALPELTNAPKVMPKYDVLASPEDLIDTWGPGQFIMDTSVKGPATIAAIRICGGVLKSSLNADGKFHWGYDTGLQQFSLFDARTKILIGASIGVRVNDACHIYEEQSWLDSSSYMDHLGPCDSKWDTTGRQGTIAAGKFVTISFSATQSRLPGQSLKQIVLARPDEELLPFLQSSWGLQVSFCTGVARRVPLSELVADLMPTFIESRFSVPHLWPYLKDKRDIIGTFRDGDIQTWFQKRSNKSQDLILQLVRSILSTMQHTGIDREGKHFVVAWILKNQPIQCFKIPCHKKENYWAQMLADSRDCATFAYITPKCLVCDGVECRGPSAKWTNMSTRLETAVCRRQDSEGTSALEWHPWTLRHSDLYFIGESNSTLLVTVYKPSGIDRPRLHISWSLMPQKIKCRINFKDWPKAVQGQLRERQTAATPAERVLVLAAAACKQKDQVRTDHMIWPSI
jgi:hypothetical protein